MQAKQPPWPTVSVGVSVRGLRYLGTSSCCSRGTIWNRNGRPATNPTMETSQGLLVVALDELGGTGKVVDLGRKVQVGPLGPLVDPLRKRAATFPP